ncbi:MAG: cell division protein FtsW [Alphaproteobacteria bacterium]|nr:cell division protein FtsW [Alphaproteobacteria bacterium]
MGKLSAFKKYLFAQWRSLDRGIFYSVLILMVFGLFLTWAAGPAVAERRHYEWSYFVYKQLVWMPVALCVLLGTSMFSVKVARRMTFLAFIGAILGMMAVLVVGSEFQGAKRWISILGVSVQPSEFIKPSFAIVVAWLLAKGKLLQRSHGWLWAVGIFGLTMLLLKLQPDFGMMLTVTTIFLTEIFLAGMYMWIVVLLAGAAVSLIPLAYFTMEHVRTRIDGFLHPTDMNSYQVRKSLETLKNAGLFGKGPGEGVVKYELPDAHTDFVMAVAAEEFGFILSSVIIVTFIYIIFRGLTLVRHNNNYFVQLAVGGLIAQITFQVFVNLGTTLNMLPPKGMTLPLISYGGSSLVSMAFAFGLILALTKQTTFSRGLE